MVLGVILYNRSSTILSGDLNLLDSAVLILFTVLILSPFFKEIKFAGFSFKSEIRDFKNDIRDEILTLRTEINNNINVTPSFEFQFSPDAKNEIPEFAKQFQNPKLIEVPNEAVELFKMRYALETKLMDIAEEF